jgi:hypothetical protein
VNNRQRPLHIAIFKGLCSGFCLLLALQTTEVSAANSHTPKAIDATINSASVLPNQLQHPAVGTPKLELTTNITKPNNAALMGQDYPLDATHNTTDPVISYAERDVATTIAQPIPNENNRMNDALAKTHAEKRWEEENKQLIALMLIFIAGTIIAFILSKYK